MWHVKVLIDEEFEQFIALAAWLMQIFFFINYSYLLKFVQNFPWLHSPEPYYVSLTLFEVG